MTLLTPSISRGHDLGPSGGGLPTPVGCACVEVLPPRLPPPSQAFLTSILAGQLRKEGSGLASREAQGHLLEVTEPRCMAQNKLKPLCYGDPHPTGRVPHQLCRPLGQVLQAQEGWAVGMGVSWKWCCAPPLRSHLLGFCFGSWVCEWRSRSHSPSWCDLGR